MISFKMILLTIMINGSISLFLFETAQPRVNNDKRVLNAVWPHRNTLCEVT